MEVHKLNPQQIYIFSSDSELIASPVPAVSLKFWYMFIIEITLCYFVRLNGMIKWMLYPIWEATSIDEWLYNGGPYELIVLPPRARKGSCWRWRGISAKF